MAKRKTYFIPDLFCRLDFLPQGAGLLCRDESEVRAVQATVFKRAFRLGIRLPAVGAAFLNFALFAKFETALSLSKGWGFSLGLRLALALEIERHCRADEILQGRLIDLVAFVDVDGAPDIPVEAGVE